MSNRKTGKLLAVAAVAGLGLAGMTQSADAGLIVDVRASFAVGGTISADGKTVTGSPSEIWLNVYGVMTGQNSVQLTGQFIGAPNPVLDTRNDESLQIVTGLFKSSTGGLLGNFQAGQQRIDPFIGSGSSDGALNDLDGDGDLDIGVLGTAPEGMFSARSGNPTFATMANATTPNPEGSAIVNAQTSELLIGSVVWKPTGGTGGTELNFVPRPDTGGGTATWFEDGGTALDPSKGAFAAGTPVVVGTVIPEPASLGLLGMAGLGLLARRRKA